MSLSILPRGVAAKRGGARDDSIASPVSEQPEQMQLDVASSPTSSTGERPQNRIPSEVPQSARRNQNQPPSKSTVYQRKPPKPIKPRELCVLIETAMSDYALWANADLRRYAADRNTSGYLSLARLLNDSPLVQATGRTIAEASVFQALKYYGSGFLELQLKLTNAARNRQKAGGDGLYNIRRVDWEGLRMKPDPDHISAMSTLWDRRSDAWDKRMIYVENIPRGYWSLPAALLFIHSCARSPSHTTYDSEEDVESAHKMYMDIKTPPEILTIQNIELPAHARASEGDLPVCKGFAFVTFTDLQDAQRFLVAWPWKGTDRRMQAGQYRDGHEDEGGEEYIGDQLMNLDLSKERNDSGEAVREGIESGLRSIRLNEWEGLKKEYLAWQAELYEGMKPSEPGAPRYNQGNLQATSLVAPHNTQQGREAPPHFPHTNERSEQHGPAATDHFNQSFPQGCLLFIKNLHPQTNKTTLKNLFENALESTPRGDGRGGLDYVDWSKGMSSCHVRLSHTSAADALTTYFTTHSIVQTDGNDAEGQPLSRAMTSPTVLESGLKPLVAELVEGRAEKIYWEKVPQKIKSVALAKSNAISQAADAAALRASDEPKDGERENKRRRRA